MLKNIEKELASWNWKGQTYGKASIPGILSRLERGFYQTREVEVDLDVFDLKPHSFKTSDLFDFMVHYKLVENADLKYPIVLNQRGNVIDGRHRICKAILAGKKSLKGIMILDGDITGDEE